MYTNTYHCCTQLRTIAVCPLQLTAVTVRVYDVRSFSRVDISRGASKTPSPEVNTVDILFYLLSICYRLTVQVDWHAQCNTGTHLTRITAAFFLPWSIHCNLPETFYVYYRDTTTPQCMCSLSHLVFWVCSCMHIATVCQDPHPLTLWHLALPSLHCPTLLVQ